MAKLDIFVIKNIYEKLISVVLEMRGVILKMMHFLMYCKAVRVNLATARVLLHSGAVDKVSLSRNRVLLHSGAVDKVSFSRNRVLLHSGAVDKVS